MALSDGDRRLQAIEDHIAIEKLIYRYAHCIDRGDADGVAALFAPDGRFRTRIMNEARELGPDAYDITGHEALTAFAKMVFQRIITPPSVAQANVLTNAVIEVDGDTANASTYFTLIKATATGREIAGYGRYLDIIVRCPDGQWRFKDRRSEVETPNPG